MFLLKTAITALMAVGVTASPEMRPELEFFKQSDMILNSIEVVPNGDSAVHLFISGNYPKPVDIFMNHEGNDTLVAENVTLSDFATVSAAYKPGSVYKVMSEGVLLGLARGQTAPSLREWAKMGLLLMFISSGMVFLRKRRFA